MLGHNNIFIFKNWWSIPQIKGCNLKWTLIFLCWYPFSSGWSWSSKAWFKLRKSFIWIPLYIFSIQKASFIFLFGYSKFCSGTWWIIFGELTNTNDSFEWWLKWFCSNDWINMINLQSRTTIKVWYEVSSLIIKRRLIWLTNLELNISVTSIWLFSLINSYHYHE